MRKGKIAIAIHEKIVGRIDRLARESAKLDQMESVNLPVSPL